MDTLPHRTAANQNHALSLAATPHHRDVSGASLSLETRVATTAHDSDDPLSEWDQMDANSTVQEMAGSTVETPQFGPAYQMPPIKGPRPKAP